MNFEWKVIDEKKDAVEVKVGPNTYTVPVEGSCKTLGYFILPNIDGTPMRYPTRQEASNFLLYSFADAIVEHKDGTYSPIVYLEEIVRSNFSETREMLVSNGRTIKFSFGTGTIICGESISFNLNDGTTASVKLDTFGSFNVPMPKGYSLQQQIRYLQKLYDNGEINSIDFSYSFSGVVGKHTLSQRYDKVYRKNFIDAWKIGNATYTIFDKYGNAEVSDTSYDNIFDAFVAVADMIDEGIYDIYDNRRYFREYTLIAHDRGDKEHEVATVGNESTLSGEVPCEDVSQTSRTLKDAIKECEQKYSTTAEPSYLATVIKERQAGLREPVEPGRLAELLNEVDYEKEKQSN